MTVQIEAFAECTAKEITLTLKPTAATCCAPTCCAEDEATASDSVDLADAEALKRLVREKYAAVAAADDVAGCGCDPTCCADEVSDIIGDAYEGVEGYEAIADLKLGCGLPTEHAGLAEGQTVLDLGSGAGLDAFIARRIVGETGEVLGVDFTPSMVARAEANAEQLGYTNVQFLEGDLEALPLPADRVDVVVSNCVLNLVPHKQQAFAEMYRVLRSGGHFCVSDVVTRADLPTALLREASLYAGCITGAIDQDQYVAWLEAAGFTNVRIVAERPIDVPASVTTQFADALPPGTPTPVWSVTVFGEKP